MDYQDAKRCGAAMIAGLLHTILLATPSIASSEPEYALPIDCSGDKTCFIQNFVDMNPGPKLRDPFCGRATFNGHKGTDIRVNNLATMQRGIPVLAMADGIVTAIRDGVPDRLMETQKDRKRIKGRECGNGVLIDHSVNRKTRHTVQYCHLAKGSVSVKKGDHVRQGQKIGRIGLSGATQFPHIHFSARKNGKLIDPLTGAKMGTPCIDSPYSKPLLTEAALNQVFNMQDQHFLEDGYSTHGVEGMAILKGEWEPATIGKPLIYFAKFINLKKGDIIRLSIRGPQGILARSATKPLNNHKAAYTAYVGKNKSAPPGVYQGRAIVMREGKTILSREATRLLLR
ncbi:MAG: M23 family metallopeptidase [Rhizobiaceae bacterium]